MQFITEKKINDRRGGVTNIQNMTTTPTNESHVQLPVA
jgi:hypothetical protein